MFAIYINCLYYKYTPRPHFKVLYDFFLDYIKTEEKVPTIAQQELFDQYEEETIKNFPMYPIPEKLETDYISRFSNEREAWIALLRDYQSDYADFYRETLKQIQEENNNSIEALLTWGHCKTLHSVCEEMNIPILEYDLTTIRPPQYSMSVGYFLHSNKYSSDECRKRYPIFQQEAEKEGLVPFTRKELLALILPENQMHLLYDYNSPPEYDLGLAIGPSDEPYYDTWLNINNDDVIADTQKIFGNSILLRTHPAEKDYYSYVPLIQDNSASSIQFVHRCRRIATTASNVAYEAMLMGKPTYIIGDIQFAPGAMRDMKFDDDMVCSSMYINFVQFCIFAPFALMHDLEYIRWRLTEPSEMEIYQTNLKYILEKELNIDEKIATQKSGRLNAILSGRNLPIYRYAPSNNKGSQMGISNAEDWLKDQLRNREDEIFQLETELASYRSESSWLKNIFVE